MTQSAGPAVPAFQFETRAQLIEENKVIEPPLVLPAEIIVTGARVRRRGAHEVARRFEEQRQFLVEDRGVIYGTYVHGQSIHLSAINPAAISEPLQADQQRVPGKGRN